MVKKSNGWNLAEMQETLVKDTEQRIEQGFEEIRKEVKESEKTAPSDERQNASEGGPRGTITGGTQGTDPAVTYGEATPAVSAAAPGVPTASVPQAAVYRTARMFHKERTQDVLVHCPVSLHKRLKDLKDHIWDEYGERVNINNMVIEAIALWLDQQEGKSKP